MEKLDVHTVDVWALVPDEIPHPTLIAFDRMMTAEERARQQRFVFDKNKKESLVTRGIARTTLSRYREIAPEAWRFSVNEHGCPSIDPPCGLRFNLSNNPGMVVCAVCEDADIGIDVEPLDRGEQILGVAERVFSERERAELGALAPGPKLDRAVSLWTLKEAYIKARGIGMGLPLGQITMCFDADDPYVRLELDDDETRWRFRIRDVKGYRIAVCLDTGGAAMNLRLR